MIERDQILEKVSNEIIERVNPNWSKLQKIRFVYLELGKYIEKNTDFFLNDKLGVLKEKQETMLNIYNDDLIPERSIPNYTSQYQIICKSAMLFLEVTLNKLGIETREIHTIKEENGIRHWFLAAKDDDDEYLFLTLAADLPFIKNNFKTEHFATHISYIINDIKYYESEEEIPHRVLTEKELEELDRSIGYSRLYPRVEKSQVSVDEDSNAYKYLFQTTLKESSDIYKILGKCLRIKDEDFKKIEDIPDSDFLLFIEELNKYVLTKLKEQLNLDYDISRDNDINYYLSLIVNKIASDNSIILKENMPLKKQVKELRKKLPKENQEASELLNLISYLNKVNTSINDYVYLRKELESELLLRAQKVESLSSEELTESNANQFKEAIIEEQAIRQRLQTIRKDISMLELNEMLKRIAYYFVKDKIDVKDDEHVSSEYIANKLLIMFPIVFETGLDEDSYQTVFSVQGYSEQIVIIKKLLKVIFSELNYRNSKDSIDYYDKYSPVENRIQTFPLKDKTTGEYCIGFDIVGSLDEEEIYFIYVPSKNNFRVFDVLEELDEYHIISSRFSKKLNDLENDKSK